MILLNMEVVPYMLYNLVLVNDRQELARIPHGRDI